MNREKKCAVNERHFNIQSACVWQAAIGYRSNNGEKKISNLSLHLQPMDQSNENCIQCRRALFKNTADPLQNQNP